MLGVTGRTRWRLLIAFVWGPHVAARGRTSGADPSVGRLAFVDYLVSHVSLPSRTSLSPVSPAVLRLRANHSQPTQSDLTNCFRHIENADHMLRNILTRESQPRAHELVSTTVR